MGDSSTHLATLVGFRNTQYADLAAVQRSSGPLGSFYVCIDCDNENLERLGCQTCLYRAAEVFSFTFDGRNDDGDIFVGVIRSVWDWGRFVCPIGDEVNNQSKITEDAGDVGKHIAIVRGTKTNAYKSKIADPAQEDNSMTKNESGSRGSCRSRIGKGGLQVRRGDEVYEHGELGCVAVQSWWIY